MTVRSAFAVGVAAFKAGVDQFFPDVGQILHLGAKHIDPLPAGNLGVETEFLGRFAQGDKLVRRDFATRDARNDRVQSATLHVRQEAVVGVLQRLMLGLHDLFVPQAARIDVTAGLQISQPWPLPHWAMISSKVVSFFALTMANSSVRECGKCSHK